MPWPLLWSIPLKRFLPSRAVLRGPTFAGRSPEKYLPETTGAGCAFLDYDNDGWMDIYLVNSGTCDFYDPNPPLRNALYRNNRDGTFTDVTEKAGVAGGGYGMGVAVGDYDGDGFPDLYVTQYGRSILYHNNGDGTFTDVTEKAGVAAPGWASSAVWFDYDNDGRLDLFVCRFVDFDKTRISSAASRRRRQALLLHPADLSSRCRAGCFTTMATELSPTSAKTSGIAQYLGKAWGVVATDINNDGRMDLFVANDTVANFLFLNRGNGKFEEIGTHAGVAYSAEGRARSGMGVDAADFNQDGWMDLFVTNVDQEMYSLYQNNHDETFDDQALRHRHRQGDPPDERLGIEVLRLRQRRQSRSLLANGHPDDLIEVITRPGALSAALAAL